MMLLEHDAKGLLSGFGIAVPEGALVKNAAEAAALGEGPWIVKAQVPVGGRGKAGGIRRAAGPAEAGEAAGALFGTRLKGHEIRSCRLERPAAGLECYLSLALETASGRVALLASAAGGVDIESVAGDALARADAAYDEKAVLTALRSAVGALPEPARSGILSVAAEVVAAFFARELTLLEINPLFVTPQGRAVAGDAKIVLDLNALPRQAELVGLLSARAADYREANLKLAHGFDFVVLDAEGDVGLVTTGAGLSMQVADELTAMGARPFNFCDLRAGGLKGNPERLVHLLGWIAAAPNVKVTLVNIFAGITHLGEFSTTLLEALDLVPDFRLPIVARLVGHGLEEAREIVAASGRDLAIETDLDVALARTAELARKGA
ncbi:ATP-grasp domain-containing protein [Afifella sp. IM 167]|uniref:ATP-grasp domain-containing protein n=1 Tax=Afifella sp. IM 167 TaxID=2033586 RepID=UPI001CCA1323|nr:ATP-grasp domain-containing protein [Afifella sp. IM 167]MBZ8133330.1 hypothetical protein [Afifella sp. IM 167]